MAFYALFPRCKAQGCGGKDSEEQERGHPFLFRMSGSQGLNISKVHHRKA